MYDYPSYKSARGCDASLLVRVGAVAAAAGSVVIEVRRQLNIIVSLREGASGVNADHETCINMVTGAALYMMIPPAGVVILFLRAPFLPASCWVA